MKNYLILLRYKVPLAEVERHTPAHRAYLRTQYDAGVLLMSGPFVPRTAGLLWAQAADRATIDAMIERDPFNSELVADYEVIEFAPVMNAHALDGFFAQQRATVEA